MNTFKHVSKRVGQPPSHFSWTPTVIFEHKLGDTCCFVQQNVLTVPFSESSLYSWGKVWSAWTSNCCRDLGLFHKPYAVEWLLGKHHVPLQELQKTRRFSPAFVPGLVRTTLVLCLYWLSDLFSTASSLWLVPWLHQMQWWWFVFNWQAHPPSKNLQHFVGRFS